MTGRAIQRHKGADHLRLVRGDEGPTSGTGAGGPTIEPRSDEELIQGVVAGNGAIAAELYDRLAPTVDRTLFRLFGRREPDHEDLMQASFEQIVRTLLRGRYARACSLTTWASSLASHVGMNALRARRTERRFVDRNADVPEGLPGAPHPERAQAARADVARMRVHLAQLDPQKAEAVFLHDVLGHDLAEMAAITGVSVAAIQSRLVRGRKELFAKLAEDRAEEAGV